MGTAVLHPQDCLMKNPYFRQPLICTPSKIGGGGRNRNRSPRSGGRRKRSPSDNESDRSNSSKSMVDRFSTKDLVMGQVKILKRGEKIESPPSKILNRSNEMKEKKIMNKRPVEDKSDDDLITKERLGPEPEMILKEISSMMGGLFSGSVAVVSPSPSSLPFPNFSLTKKKDVGLNNLTDDNDSASKDLMRILGMK